MIGRALTRHYRLVFAFALAVAFILLGSLRVHGSPIEWFSSVIHVQSDPTTGAGRAARVGSIAVVDGSPKIYVKTASTNTGWDSSGTTGQLWSLTYSNPLASSTLSNWNQRTGVWSADTTVGYMTNGGTPESYLSLESGLLNGDLVPFDMNTGYVIEADISWTVASSPADDVGFVLYGQPFGVGAGDVRVFLRRDGSKLGWDVFGSGGSQRTDGAPGATTPGIYRRLRVQMLAGRVTFFVDGTLYFAGVPTFPATQPTRLGLWSNNGHAMFKNVKVWRILSPV